jgi:hypothetical protein
LNLLNDIPCCPTNLFGTSSVTTGVSSGVSAGVSAGVSPSAGVSAGESPSSLLLVDSSGVTTTVLVSLEASVAVPALHVN